MVRIARAARVYGPQASLRTSNSSWWSNEAAGGVSESTQFRTFNGATLIPSYCFVEGWSGGYNGTANSSTDPLLIRLPSSGPDTLWGTPDDDYGDLRLLPNSPAIDSGNSLLVPLDTVPRQPPGAIIYRR